MSMNRYLGVSLASSLFRPQMRSCLVAGEGRAFVNRDSAPTTETAYDVSHNQSHIGLHLIT